MFKLVDKLIGIITLVAMIGLAGSYTARYIDPNTFIFPSLLGLAYPYLLIANVILLLYWIARWKKMAFIELLVLAIGIPVFRTYYGTHKEKNVTDSYDLQILSYNVRYFDRYGWSKHKNTSEKLLDYLNHFPGDIICLQEFPEKSASISPQAIIRELSSYPYHRIKKNMAIFSRSPIITCKEITFDKKYTSSCLYCDIVKSGDTVRIYNIHLESYKLGQKERKFVKDISEGVGNDLSEGVKNLTSRITEANKSRAKQARQIKTVLQHSPYPFIVCGDFNDTPLSYTYQTIEKGLQDSFIENGRGLGNTYIGEFPSFRIDYILHSPHYQTISYFRETVTLSDHYPIQSKLKKRNRKN